MSARAETTSPRLLVQAAQAHAAEAGAAAGSGSPASATVAIGAAITTALCAVAMAIGERTSYEIDKEGRP